MWRKHIFREFFVLLYYVKSGWIPKPPQEQYTAAKAEATAKIPDWNCFIEE